MVLKYIKKVKSEKEIISKITKEANAQAQEVFEDIKNQHQMICTRINGISGQINNLVEISASQGADSFKSVKDKLKELEQEKANLSAQEANIKIEKDKIEERLCSSEVLINSLESFSQIVEGASPKDLAKIIPLFVKRVIWNVDDHDSTKGHMQIDFFEEFRLEMAEKVLWKRNWRTGVNHTMRQCQNKLPG